MSGIDRPRSARLRADRRFVALAVVSMAAVAVAFLFGQSPVQRARASGGRSAPTVRRQRGRTTARSAPAQHPRVAARTHRHAATGRAHQRAVAPLTLAPRSRLLAGRTTARSQTYAQPDGSTYVRLFAESRFFRDTTGRWRGIDNRLVRRGTTIANRANRYAFAAPATLDSGAVSVRNGSAWLRMALRGATGAAQTAGATATYPDALASTTLSYTAQPDSVQELLTLRDRNAPSRFTYRLTTSRGLRPRLQKRGGLVLVDASGRARMAIEPPVAWSARRPSARHPLTQRLRRRAGHWTLTTSASAGWLRRALARGPVVIDPTVQIPGATADCTIQSDLPTTSSCTGATLEVGFNGLNDHRALIKQNVAAIPRDAVVLNAALTLNLTGHTTATAKSVGVYRALRDWTTAATWNTFNGVNAWGAAGAGAASDTDATPAYTQTIGAANGAVTWYPTKLVQGWVDGSIPNQGLLVRDVNPNTTNNRLTFASSEAATGRPELDVIYQQRTGALPGYGFDSHPMTATAQAQVNLANGNLLVHQNDLSIAGTGMDFSFDRYINSLSAQTGEIGSLGRGGTATIGRDVHLQLFPDGSAAFFQGDGAALPFVRNASGLFDQPPGLNATLAKNPDGTYTLTADRIQHRLRFTNAGQLSSISDQNNNTVQLFYTASGALDHVVDTQGRTITATATSSTDNFVASLVDGGSPPGTYTYQYMGSLLTTQTDPVSRQTLYDYDANGRVTAVTNPRGTMTKITYDALGRVATLFQGNNGANTTGATTSYSYDDPSGRTFCTGTGLTPSFNTVVTDPNSHQTTYCFDAQERVLKSRDADGRTRSSSYTPNSDVATGTTAGSSTLAGFDTKYTYSAPFNSPTQRDRTTGTGATPTKLTDKLSYNSTAGTCSPAPGWLKFYPDTSTDPQGNVTTLTYDCAGNVTSERDQLTIQNQLTLGNYDSRGNPHTATDANGNTTTYGYDAVGRLTSVTPPLVTAPSVAVGPTKLTYDSMSRIRTVTDGKGQATTYDYNLVSQLTKVTYADGSTTTFTYFSDGYPEHRVDSATGQTDYDRDRLGRLVSEVFPDGTSNIYTYDLVGNLASYSDGSAATTYAQGPANLLASETDPSSTNPYSFGYDGNAVRTSTAFPNGVVESITAHDGIGRMKHLVAAKGATTLKDLTYSYLKAGADTELLQSVTDNRTGNVTTYSYDVLNRLTEALTKSGATTIRDYKYALDGNGNILRRDTTINGVATTTSYAYNQANELCWSFSGVSAAPCGSPPAGAVRYTYDANGNETASSAGFAGSYNARDQQTSLNGVAFNFLGATNDELIGDGTTNLHNSILGLTSRTTAGATDRFTRDDSGALLARRSASGTSYYLLDRLGSVIGTTDSAGALTGSFDYDPYGNSIGPAPSPFGFVGGYLAGGTNVYHFGARFYDPGTARWTQQDPVVGSHDPQEVDRYAYAANDPVNLTDPSGCSAGQKIKQCLFFCALDHCGQDSLKIQQCLINAHSASGFFVCLAKFCGFKFYRCAAGCFIKNFRPPPPPLS